jgi:hypothetical protein
MARIRIAKEGYTVEDDLRFLSLDTNYSSLMIIAEASVAGTATEYTHGLGYLPTTIEFFKFGTQWFPMDSAIYDLDDNLYLTYAPKIEFDSNKAYFYNPDELPIKLFISGNSADNSIGSGKNTAFGKIKVAKDGQDVTATDVRQYKFCSGLDTIKKDLALSGTAQIVGDGTFKKVEVSHNLGYVPIVTARISSNTYDSAFNGRYLPQNWQTYDFVPISFYITTTKIVFFTYNQPVTVNITFNLYRNKIE